MEIKLSFSAETFRCSKLFKRLELWLSYFLLKISWDIHFDAYLLRKKHEWQVWVNIVYSCLK